jgi:micrococcal nuclease
MKGKITNRKGPYPLFLIILSLLAAVMCRGQEGGFQEGRVREGAVQVYVTNTGKRYHREGCSSLRRSRIPISLEDAARSEYEPCSVCRPPVLSETELASEEAARLPRLPLYRVNTSGLAASADADISRMVPAEVIDHVDGDTVRVRILQPPEGVKPVETVRLLGVDTPETVHPSRPVERFGKEASDFTRERLLGQGVYLAFDWDLRDRYGRLLAYIYTGDGGCFNTRLIREGYSHAYTRYPFQFMEEFRRLEEEAREGRQGLWNSGINEE